jgi:hypothetical protein
MNHQDNQPVEDLEQLNQRIMASARSHRVKLRVLTTAACLFGIAAVIVSLTLIWVWRAEYWPIQERLQNQISAIDKATAAAPDSDRKQLIALLGRESVDTAMVSMGAAAVALAVAVLGMGSLVLAAVVILNRRVTLSQINASLVQISSQLRNMQQSPQPPAKAGAGSAG